MASLQTLDHKKVRQVPHDAIRINLSVGSQKQTVGIAAVVEAGQIGGGELLPNLSLARRRIEAVDAQAGRTFRPRKKHFPSLGIPSNELVSWFDTRHSARRAARNWV